MNTNPTSFSNVEDFEKFANQFIARFQIPSQDEIYQMFTTFLATIELHMPPSVKPASKLSLKQVALLHIYNNIIIPKGKKANSIAVKYGHNSGDKLYDLYRTLTSKQNRTAVTGRQATNRLKDISAIKPELAGEALAQAEREEQEIKPRREMKSKS
jgi:hypothetical protein